MRVFRPDPARVVCGGGERGVAAFPTVIDGIKVAARLAPDAGQGPGQNSRLRLSRWAITCSLGPDNPAFRHSRLPVRSSRDRL